MDSMKIAFAGDFAPTNIDSNNKIEIEKSLKDKLNNNDYFLINLEAPITDNKNKRMKAGSNLKLDKSCIAALSELCVSGVSLANNHIFDYKKQGVDDTINHLNNNKIKYWGIGANKTEAWKPLFLEKNNIRVAIVSYAEHEFNWISDDDWCTSMLESGSNILQITELSKVVDHVVVFSHTGPENWHYPSPRQVKLFRNFIDAGASIVLNSHSHSIMGLEYYKNKPIYYGLGNFFFPKDNMLKSWYSGLLVEIELTTDNVAFITSEDFIQFSNNKIGVADNINELKSSFLTFSEHLHDDQFIQKKWNEFGKQEQKKLFKEVLKGSIAILLGFIFGRYSKRFRQIKAKGIAIFRGYSTCENHIENIGNIFNQKINENQ